MPDLEIGKYFDPFAEDYDELTLAGEFKTNSLYGKVLREVECTPGSVLDIGAGTGLTIEETLLQLQTEPPQAVIAIDPSKAMLDRLRSKYPDHHKPRVQTVQTTAEDYFNVTEEKYDLITAISVFPYLHEPTLVIEGIASHLTLGGYAIFNYEVRILGDSGIGGSSYTATHHVTGETREIHLYSPSEVDEMVWGSGLEIVVSELHAVAPDRPGVIGGIVVAGLFEELEN